MCFANYVYQYTNTLNRRMMSTLFKKFFVQRGKKRVLTGKASPQEMVLCGCATPFGEQKVLPFYFPLRLRASA
jgi:hypothetical protein